MKTNCIEEERLIKPVGANPATGTAPESSPVSWPDILDRYKREPLRERLGREYGLEFKGTGTNCPFCGDGTRSFSVYSGGDGFWHWKCHSPKHGEKNTGTYIDFKMLAEGKTQEQVICELKEQHGLSTKKRRICAYDYQNEAGEVVYRRVRYSPKSFEYEHREGGEWKKRLKDKTRYLYRLPELIKSSEIIILEGEKDCDNVRALGLTATTAGSVNDWKPEFAGYFSGKKVIICLDVGEQEDLQAKKIAQDLYGKASSIKCLNLRTLGLTGAKGDKDMTDYLNKLGDIPKEEKGQRILDAIAQAPEYVTSGAPKENPHRIWSVKELETAPPRQVILDPILARDEITMLVGGPSAGKSTLSMNIAISAAIGQGFCGFNAPEPVKVLAYFSEHGIYQMRHCIDLMQARIKTNDIPNLCLISTKEKPILVSSKEGKNAMIQQIETTKPSLLIFDSLKDFHDRNENKWSLEMEDVMKTIFEFRNTYKSAILLSHHLGKPTETNGQISDRIRGHGNIGANMDTRIYIVKHRNPYRQLQFEIRGGFNVDVREVEMDLDDLWYSLAKKRPFSPKPAKEDMIFQTLLSEGGRIIGKNRFVVLLCKEYGVSERTAHRRIKESIGRVISVDKTRGKNECVYRLK